MKRLMIVSMMLIAGLAQAEDAAVTPPAQSAATQSSSDAASKTSDDAIEIANVHHINLDTTEVDGGGNWLNKRIWYERSQAVFDEIRVMVSNITDIRIQFSNEVNAVGQKIDSFFETVDFTKGQLDDKFKEILVMLETEQKLTGDLSPEERNLQTTIKAELAVIDQIGKDIKSIGEVDNKIDQTLMQAFKTIDECREYETKAWSSFKAIGKELDDKKARNLYYQMNNYKQNIDQKSSYLNATLLPYLHNVLVAKIENNISKINESIAQLKTKGVDLEKIMSKSQEDDLIQIHAREKSAAEIAVKKALEVEQAKAKEAADKAAKALKEANEKSFSNVMNRYYESTIGKIVGFFYKGDVAASIDSAAKHVKSYSYPVATYIYHGVISIKTYMHDLVEHIMMYFGGKSAVKKTVAEKIEQKIEAGGPVVEKIKEKIASESTQPSLKASAGTATDKDKSEAFSAVATLAPSKATSTINDAASSDKTTVNSAPDATPASSETPAAQTAPVPSAEPAKATSTPAVSVTPAEADKTVVVQSMEQSDNSDIQNNSRTFYQVIKNILDFIGTILMSIYNCVAQLCKLIFSFSAYITSGN